MKLLNYEALLNAFVWILFFSVLLICESLLLFFLEKVLVHEWGHLRWGLFDEYPIGGDITEHFYQSPSTNTIEASKCNINVLGRNRHRMTGDDCVIDPDTSLPEEDCRFYPNRAQTKALSSLMYYHFLPSVCINYYIFFYWLSNFLFNFLLCISLPI